MSVLQYGQLNYTIKIISNMFRDAAITLFATDTNHLHLCVIGWSMANLFYFDVLSCKEHRD